MNIDFLSEKVIQCNEAVSVFNFTGLSQTEHRDVLSWRTHPDIALYSKTKNIDWNMHMSFVENLKITREQAYWLIKHKQKPVAVCNLFQITDESAISGIYIAPNLKGYGVLATLVIQDIAFNKLDLSVLHGQILPNNLAALRIAQFFDAECSVVKNGYIKTMQTQEEWRKRNTRYAKLMSAFK